MNLRYRNFRLADTANCLRLLEPYPDSTPKLLSQLPTFWKRLFGEQAFIGVAIEECEPGGPPRMVAFGGTLFVNEDFMRDARAAREPGLLQRLVDSELGGDPSPILRRAAIARANAADGLNTVIIHTAPKMPLPEEPGYAYRYYLKEAIVWAHRGYRIKEGLQEIWSEKDLDWIKAFLTLRSDYSDYYRRTGQLIPVHRPYLYGVSADEALSSASSLAAPVFLYTPPRFHLPRGAQDLLARALDGETDTALANSLHVSLATVKMRWRQIYERIEEIAPELLPDLAGNHSEANRGKEKRRYVIEYIREHPEELRPFAPSRRGSQTSTGEAAMPAATARRQSPGL
jgi:hypothetical protein